MASTASKFSTGPIFSCSKRSPLVRAGAGAASFTGACGAGAATAAVAVAGAALGRLPAAKSTMRRTKSPVGTASPAPPAWWRANKLREASADSSRASTISGIGVISWRRSRSRSDSILWVNSATSVKPKVAEPPLIEWAQRKMPLSSSSLACVKSKLSSICSIWSRFSAASSKKTW